jgi:hypothetical protein
MKDIKKLKVINDQLNNKSVTLFSLYPLMVRVFNSSVDGQTLTFKYNFTSNILTDKQTGSQWDFEGLSISGPPKGKQLLRLPFDEGHWFEWSAFYPDTKIY